MKQENPEFELAAKLVLETQQNVFLTGNAGTGKTTFLKHIRENSLKATVIVAPTGVAAINAQGVTLHSFFQLPFGTFLPDHRYASPQTGTPFYTRMELFRNARIAEEKRKIFRAMELLVIDEISMVRADTLDAIDAVLRHYRDQPLRPFGGVQVLYIGDLYQLPPVVQDEEWQWLKDHYESPFFFDSKVTRAAPPLRIELKKIYRQKDKEFIDILNAVRESRVTELQLKRLHHFYDPGFEKPKDDDYITLTTHNYKANAINEAELNKLENKSHTYEARIEGDFGEKLFPAEKSLQLKVGAQIMFIKNDKGEERRYFNGKLATISKINADGVFVKFRDNPEDWKIEKEEWKNIRYQLNEQENKLEEQTLGKFSQYPIRLAWAITIHKSQGLTFEKAIVDAGDAFSPGQVYVALSRLTGTEGMVLKSKIRMDSLKNEPAVSRYLHEAPSLEQLENEYEKEKGAAWRRKLEQSFDWSPLLKTLEQLLSKERKKKAPKDDLLRLLERFIDRSRAQGVVTEKFIIQLQKLYAEETPSRLLIEERVNAALQYFRGLIETMEAEISAIPGSLFQEKKKISPLQASLNIAFEQEKTKLGQAISWLRMSFGEDAEKPLAKGISAASPAPAKEARPEKGSSQRISLEMFREGKTIPEIAIARGMAEGTIESHLCDAIGKGELDTTALVSVEKAIIIQNLLDSVEEIKITAAREKLGKTYSFTEIRAVMSKRRFLQQGASKKTLEN